MKKWMTVWGSIALSALVVSGCGGDKDAATKDAATTAASASGIPDGPIKIGMPIALTGPFSYYDLDSLNGAKAAVADINAAGGVKGHQLEIITADTKSEIAQGGAAALDVISKGAKFLLPSIDYSYGGGAARIANSKKIPSLTTAGDLNFGLKGIGPYAFDLWPGAETVGTQLANYFYKAVGKRAYLLNDTTLSDNTLTCEAFEKRLTELGGEVVGSDTFKNGDQSIATQITRLRGSISEVDGIHMCSYPPGGASAVKQIRAAGITQPIGLHVAFDGTGWLEGIPDVGKVYIHSMGVSTPGEAPNPEMAKAFEGARKLGKPNTGFAVLSGYSGVQALADAVEAADSVDGTAVKDELEKFKDHELVYGPTTFTPTCHARVGAPSTIATIEGGELKFVEVQDAVEISEDSC